MKKYLILLALPIVLQASAQQKENLLSGVEIMTETQASMADETTPLWLNANKYGLSSLEKNNSYVRFAAERRAENDSLRQWRWGYALDAALTDGHEQTVIIQQAYAELQWKTISLTLGAKQQPAEMKNMELSSGAMAFGWNARPIPQVRLAIDWFAIPHTNGWWQWKMHGSYGLTTDGGWQKRNVSGEKNHYTNNILYHEKALFWKFGKEDAALPLTFELGLHMAAQFGGTSYNVTGRDVGEHATVKHDSGFKAFVQAFTASGSGETDGSTKNTAGNHLGVWNMQLKWHGTDWSVAARFERFFEDQSMMFIQYGIYDHLLGLDATLPSNPFITALTIEHLSTRDQSGAILHDAAPNIPDKMNGRDNYYNHDQYSGYQHWGQTLGNPLLTSPIYNNDGSLTFQNNRVKAWHLALAGDPTSWLHWRAMATFTRNWGTYDYPLYDPTNQQYYLLEAQFSPKTWRGWQATIAGALDRGKLLGNNCGAQLTIRRYFKF